MPPTADKRWRIRTVPADDVEALGGRLGLTPLAARILWNRGITGDDEARAFMRPALSALHDPFILPEMRQAADRIREAVQCGERIVIYGDYDVDGIAATSILIRCLRFLGAEPGYYIPMRTIEGYGLNADAIRQIAAEGTRLLVTVDCGITAVDEVALARELGMDVIVTDHHEPGEIVPADACLIDPKLPGCPYPFSELAGAGLAFKLAWAIGKSLSQGERVQDDFKEFLLDIISLAALGTVADVVPLRDENRIIAHFGLMGLSGSSAEGIRALCEAARLTTPTLTASDIAFRIAPRLNAAGRLGCARRCVELLITESSDQARAIAAELGQVNTQRQKLQERIVTEVREAMAAEPDLESKRAIVLAREGWHAGVIGIVASRIVNETAKPTLLLTLDEGEARGSGRSIEALNLFEALQECGTLLTAFGGHAMAAGLRLDQDKLEEFREQFDGVVAARLEGADLTPALDLDAEASLGDITRPLLDEIESFAPFGSRNHEPVFAAYDLAVPGSIRRMGSSGKHLSFYVRQNGASLRAVAFGFGDMADALAEAGMCSLAFVPHVNRWRGKESIELQVQDMKIGPAPEPVALDDGAV